MRCELAFSCYGAQLLIVDAAGADVCARLERVLPPNILLDATAAPDASFVVERATRRPDAKGKGAVYRVVHRGEVLMRARRVESVVDRLRREIDEAVALFSRRGLFVHAGVVGWRGHAIVIPGRSMSGKSHLIAELVRCGATYYSDEFAVLDDDGLVRPYARAPVIRRDADAPRGAVAAPSRGGAAEEPLPVALVVSTLYRPGATWQPEEVRGARALLPIIDNTVLARRESAHLLRLCRRIAPTVVTLQGPRPDATIAAPRILAYLDTLLDGGPPVQNGGKAVIVVERARAARAAVQRQRELTQAGSVPVAPQPEAGDVTPLPDDDVVLLLHWNGRFGNRMHQYAYGVTYARRNDRRFWLPSDWEGTQLFETQHHVLAPHGGLRASLGQARKVPREDRLELARQTMSRLRLITPEDPRENYRRRRVPVCFDSVSAYHPSIFARMSRQHLRSIFAFSEAVKRLDIYKRLEDRQGTYDIAHLRRDDVSNPKYNQKHPQGYSVISRESYIRAFEQYGFDPERVEWTSDDYSRQWHVDRPPSPRGKWRYPTGSEVLPGIIFDWLEDFLRLYFARTIFRANSSFSWWAAFLAPQARVFSPLLERRHIYGVDGMEEIAVDFVEGNHPHWMFGNADIVIGA